MTSNVLATLQGHQVVLIKELEEIDADLQLLQGMSSRYLQSDISFVTALDSLTHLRNEKAAQLAQVNTQIQGMRQSLEQSSALVTELQRSAQTMMQTALPTTNSSNVGGGNVSSIAPGPLGGAGGGVSFSGIGGASVPPAATNVSYQYTVPGTTHQPLPTSNINTNVSTSAPAPNVPLVTLAAPSGLMVSTNSSILTHSPARRGQ